MKKQDLLKAVFTRTDRWGNPVIVDTQCYGFHAPIRKILSSKPGKTKHFLFYLHDEWIFPAYFPLVGKHYDHHKILAYATAQNLEPGSKLHRIYISNYDKLCERLYYFNNFWEKYPDENIPYNQVSIYPYQTGVMPALLAVLLFAKFKKTLEHPDQVVDYVAVSNYYKFSLHNGKHDIHPEPNGKHPVTKYVDKPEAIRQYWAQNDRLVCLETGILKPRYIVAFKGRKINALQSLCNPRCKVLAVNDPSWILSGHGGHLSPSGSWHRYVSQCADAESRALVDKFLPFVTGRYASKREAVRVYLLYYYCKWKEEKRNIIQELRDRFGI